MMYKRTVTTLETCRTTHTQLLHSYLDCRLTHLDHRPDSACSSRWYRVSATRGSARLKNAANTCRGRMPCCLSAAPRRERLQINWRPCTTYAPLERVTSHALALRVAGAVVRPTRSSAYGLTRHNVLSETMVSAEACGATCGVAKPRKIAFIQWDVTL